MENFSDIINIHKWQMYFYRNYTNIFIPTFISAILLLFTCSVYFNFNLFSIPFDICFRFFIIIFIFGIWFSYLFVRRNIFFFKVNRTKKVGLIVRVRNSDVVEYNDMQYKFLKYFRASTNQWLKLIIIDDKTFQNIDNNTILAKTKSNLIVDVEENYGNDSNVPKYIVKVKNINFSLNNNYFQYYIPLVFKYICNELILFLNITLSFSSENDLNDRLNNSQILDICIKYFLAIVYMFDNKLESSFEFLDEIGYQVKNCNVKENICINHIKKNINRRYLENYYFKCCSLSDNKLELVKMDIYHNKLKEYIVKCKSVLSSRDLNMYFDSYYAVVLYNKYELGYIDEAYCLLEEWEKRKIKLIQSYYFDKAFLLAIKGLYSDSLNYYLKTKKIRDIDSNYILNLIVYFNNHINDDNEMSVLFCDFIVNYLYADFVVAERDLNRIKVLDYNLYSFLEKEIL